MSRDLIPLHHWSSSMTADSAVVHARRAIEALRSGVPNRDAVSALGCHQPQIQEQFDAVLRNARTGASAGLLVEGGFGTGKSHLFVHLQQQAVAQKFVCSRVVISKETPLHDSLSVYRSACESALVPGRRGAAINEIAMRLDFRSEAYARFYEWAHSPGHALDVRFPASLYLFQRVQSDQELIDRLIRFWAGEQISVSEFKKSLKAFGQAASYPIVRAIPRSLATNYFAFAAQLIRAAGYAGWVLLIDEVELIARYPLRQRARAYAEIGRWLADSAATSYAGVVPVLALTDDFRTAVLEQKGDRETLPGRIRDSVSDDSRELADAAEKGMRAIERGGVTLRPPTPDILNDIERRVRQIHGSAYDWTPPALPSAPRMLSARIRQLLKSWITQWDLLRLDPSVQVNLQVDELNPDYTEDENLGANGDGEKTS